MSIVGYSRLHPNFESNKLSFEMETQRSNTNSEPTETKPEILPLRDPPEESLFGRGRRLPSRPGFRGARET